MEKKTGKIKITKDGPYVVSGGLPLVKDIIVADENGDSKAYKKGNVYNCGAGYSLCRCGASGNKPFCDGSHTDVKFDGTETASRKNYADACKKVTGPGLDLDDLPELCARARFCHDQKGDVWGNTENSDDPRLKREAERQSCLCPSGRLVAKEKSGKVIEPKMEPEIGLIEDPQKHVGGPIWAKGGIEVEGVDGKRYETRNRATLCRCGRSRNKPFCDGSHIDAKFSDGDESIR